MQTDGFESATVDWCVYLCVLLGCIYIVCSTYSKSHGLPVSPH